MPACLGRPMLRRTASRWRGERREYMGTENIGPVELGYGGAVWVGLALGGAIGIALIDYYYPWHSGGGGGGGAEFTP